MELSQRGEGESGSSLGRGGDYLLHYTERSEHGCRAAEERDDGGRRQMTNRQAWRDRGRAEDAVCRRHGEQSGPDATPDV